MNLAFPTHRKPGPGFKIDSRRLGGFADAYWSFAHASLFDRAKANNLTLHGYATTDTKFAPGGFGNTALTFLNASGQYADCPCVPETGALSISAWIKPTAAAFSNSGEIISNYDATATYCQYNFQLDTTGRILFFVGDNRGSVQFSEWESTNNNVLTAGVWSHVCAVSTGGLVSTSCSIYVNGQPIALTHTNSGAPSIPDTANCGNTAIGNAGSFLGNYYDGLIDNVLLLPWALTPQQVWRFYVQPFFFVPRLVPTPAMVLFPFTAPSQPQFQSGRMIPY
jgi:hypothetical protein